MSERESHESCTSQNVEGVEVSSSLSKNTITACLQLLFSWICVCLRVYTLNSDWSSSIENYFDQRDKSKEEGRMRVWLLFPIMLLVLLLPHFFEKYSLLELLYACLSIHIYCGP